MADTLFGNKTKTSEHLQRINFELHGIVNFYGIPNQEENKFVNRLLQSKKGTNYITLQCFCKTIGLINILFFNERAVVVASMLTELKTAQDKKLNEAMEKIKSEGKEPTWYQSLSLTPASIKIDGFFRKENSQTEDNKRYTVYIGNTMQLIDNEAVVNSIIDHNDKNEEIKEPNDKGIIWDVD